MPLIFPTVTVNLFYSWAKPGSEYVLFSGYSETEQGVYENYVMRVMVRTFWQWSTIRAVCIIRDLYDFSEWETEAEREIPQNAILFPGYQEVISSLFIFLTFAKVTVLKFWKFKNAIKYNYIDVDSSLSYRLCWWISSSWRPKEGCSLWLWWVSETV